MSIERTSQPSLTVSELKIVVPQAITPRQKDVLELTAQGLTSEEIGDRLGLKPGSIPIYVKASRKRLQASTKTEAVLRAERYGLIEIPALTAEDKDKVARLMPHQLRTLRALTDYDGIFSVDHQIAERLHLQKITVRNYLKSSLKMLDAHTRTRAAVMVTLFDRDLNKPL